MIALFRYLGWVCFSSWLHALRAGFAVSDSFSATGEGVEGKDPNFFPLQPKNKDAEASVPISDAHWGYFTLF